MSDIRFVYVFPEVIRHRKTGEMLVGVFAVRDDVRVIAAQVGKTKEDALCGFRSRVMKRCHDIVIEGGKRDVVYRVHYTEEPRQVKALQFLLKSLGSKWDYIRQGVLDAYDYTHQNYFLTEVDRAAEARRKAAEDEATSQRRGDALH
jgi:hypothetical protein